YGLASIIGPLVGGLITDSVGWRGVFLLNLPIGAIALALVVRTFNPVHAHGFGLGRRPRLDYLGGLTLVLAVAPLLLALSLGGHELPWTSPALMMLVLAGAALLAAFARVEMRAAEPVVPLALLASRSVGLPTAGMA